MARLLPHLPEIVTGYGNLSHIGPANQKGDQEQECNTHQPHSLMFPGGHQVHLIRCQDNLQPVVCITPVHLKQGQQLFHPTNLFPGHTLRRFINTQDPLPTRNLPVVLFFLFLLGIYHHLGQGVSCRLQLIHHPCMLKHLHGTSWHLGE